MGAREFELVLVGGGLQNGLIALGALHVDPRRRIAVVEANAALGGNHTWCAHPHDVPAAAREWVDPLFVCRWPGYEVCFPGSRRTLAAEYAAITSTRFDAVVRQALDRGPNSALYLGRRVTALEPHAVMLDDGTRLHAELVVDGRGPEPAQAAQRCGFQKFLGIEIELEQPHGLRAPILMDATVAQRDGFRFLYCLPLAPDRMLIEDTCFSRCPALDHASARTAMLEYGARFGRTRQIRREESGVLPMPWWSTSQAPDRSPLLAGYRGGWFHPATGYSLPPALRLACHLSQRRASEVFDRTLAEMYRAHRAQVRFAQRLNRLLFLCFEPHDTWNVFARFYTFPAEVIHRFYALSMTPMDRARLLVGWPPRGFSFRKAFAMARVS